MFRDVFLFTLFLNRMFGNLLFFLVPGNSGRWLNNFVDSLFLRCSRQKFFLKRVLAWGATNDNDGSVFDFNILCWFRWLYGLFVTFTLISAALVIKLCQIRALIILLLINPCLIVLDEDFLTSCTFWLGPILCWIAVEWIFFRKRGSWS